MPAFSRAIILAGITAVVSFGQGPAFGAISVKAVHLAAHPAFGPDRGGPGTSDPGRIHYCCVGLYSLVMKAYDLELDRIMGPDWVMENMGPNLYEVDATMPPDTTRAQYQLMMERFLRERFHLEIHREARNFPGYELVVAEEGSKLKESKPPAGAATADAATGDASRELPKRSANGKFILPPGPQMLTSLGWGVIVVQMQQKPLSDLVKVMGRMINQSLGENPNDYASPKARVLDHTGLTGRYDFTLHFSCELCQFAAVNGAVAPAPPPPADSPGGEPSIFVALRKQLGLKLNKASDIPLDVVVVDRADKIPVAN